MTAPNGSDRVWQLLIILLMIVIGGAGFYLRSMASSLDKIESTISRMESTAARHDERILALEGKHP